MNKTYKVVFNKVRGALMVANEVTSSVQKKGTKTVLAVTAALAMGSVMAQASTETPTENVLSTITLEGWSDVSYNVTNNNQDYFGGQHSYGNHVTASDVVFSNNKLWATEENLGSGAADAQGGAMYLYSYGETEHENTVNTFNNVRFENNSVRTESNQGNRPAAYGGALLIKGGTTTFTNTVFIGNTATAAGNVVNTTDKAEYGGGSAAGGAIFVDSTFNDYDYLATLNFEVTQDGLINSGNTVSSGLDKPFTDGYTTKIPTAGGFLYLDRAVTANFNVAEGVTYTIGVKDAWKTDKNMDSIASSVYLKTATHDNVVINKNGAGTLLMHGSLNDYYGTLNINAGTMEVTSDWAIANTVTVQTGSELKLGNVSFTDVKTASGYDGSAGGSLEDVVDDKGAIDVKGKLTISGTLEGGADSVTLNGGTLQTGSSNVFTNVSEGKVLFASSETADNFVTSDTELVTNATLKLTSGTVALTDEGYYTAASLEAMANALQTDEGNVLLSIINGTAVLADGETSMGLVEDAVHNTTAGVDANVSGTGDTATATTSLTTNTAGGRKLEVKVDATETGSPATVALTTTKASSTLILQGDDSNSSLVEIKSTSEDQATTQAAENVTVGENVTLQLGLGTAAAEETSGQLANVEVQAGATLAAEHIVATVQTLSGNGTVTVGTSEADADGSSTGYRATLNVGTLDMNGGMIFVDPAWEDGTALADIGKASHLTIGAVGEAGINTKIVAGQNALVTIGATAEEAMNGFNSINNASAAVAGWGKEGVTAALYIGQPLTFGANGGILVDGSLDTAPADTTVTAGSVTVAAYGMLMVDQTAIGSETAINGTLSLADGSYVGLVNANEGTIKLANTVNVAQGDVVDVVTDNPFITAALSQDGNSVAASLDAANGLGALASTGLQAMTRRADSVLASTIADRTSIDQELNAGINLWVDVRGENYQADDFDNGGSFEADMGYGTFGGDMAFGAFTAGAAFQYGTGSLRSSVSSIKNSIDNYAFALYGTYKVSDAFKLAAELAYVWGENDITSSQAALNQSVDTEMYSFGLRAMYELKAGNFSFVPSIGLRVSQLSTDAFQVGSVKVEDQDQTLVQVPIALRINASEFDASGWSVAPSFKIAYVPTFGDKDIEVLNHTQDVIDTAPVQADFGLRIGKDNMMFNVNMLLGAGEYGTSAIGGKVGFKYAF